MFITIITPILDLCDHFSVVRCDLIVTIIPVETLAIMQVPVGLLCIATRIQMTIEPYPNHTFTQVAKW